MTKKSSTFGCKVFQREKSTMFPDRLKRMLRFLTLALTTIAAHGVLAQTSSSVTVSMIQAGTTRTYTVPWSPAMSVLNALEQALPAAKGTGSFSLNYFPEYAGYFVSAVAGVPAPGGNEYWSTCLSPAGPGSTTITLPLAPNKILVGSGDTIILAYNQSCPTSASPH
jgi:hypothetical protein